MLATICSCAVMDDLAVDSILLYRTPAQFLGAPLHKFQVNGKPVSQSLVILVPADGAQDDHLKLLALVARLFSERGFRTQLDSASDATAAADAFRAEIAQVTAASS